MGPKSEYRKFLTEHHSTIELEVSTDSNPSYLHTCQSTLIRHETISKQGDYGSPISKRLRSVDSHENGNDGSVAHTSFETISNATVAD